MTVVFVYVTAGNSGEARSIGRSLVEERLAACANVVDQMNSIYWWQGAVQEAEEAVLILKTTEDRVAPLIARVKDVHSYDCPCIEVLPVIAGYQPYLDWVAHETHDRSAANRAGLSGCG